MSRISALLIIIILNYATSHAKTLFVESFENNDFTKRGWYDVATPGTIVSDGYSGNCLYWKWSPGQSKPITGGIMRKAFNASDELFIKFYIKFSRTWKGSQKTCGHLVMIFSNLDSEYANPNWSYLNTYFEVISDNESPHTIRPVFQIQDNRRINISDCSQGFPPCDLTGVTENRSVSGCNGTLGDLATNGGRCYFDGNKWLNERRWISSDSRINREDWVKIEAYFKMNTSRGGRGQANGIMDLWINDLPILAKRNILYRTHQDADKKWAQFVLSPYIGDGAETEQMVWIDELEVSDVKPTIKNSTYKNGSSD